MISVIMVIYLYLLDLGIVKILHHGCKNIKKIENAHPVEINRITPEKQVTKVE